MDDINLIRTVLVDEVDDDHRAAARHKLLNAIAVDGGAQGVARRPQRKMWWSLVGAGTGLVAAAAVAVVALGTGSVAPNGPPAGTRVEAAPETAQQFLLVAAAQAERAPATSGRYWHVRWVTRYGTVGSSDVKVGVSESWQSAEPRLPSWMGSVRSVGGTYETSLDKATRIGYGWEAEFSVADVGKLPTKPEELRRVLLAAGQKNQPNGGPVGDDYVFGAAAGLLGRAPASSAQMAALYRLLATLPGVQLGGTATDSEGRSGVLVKRGAVELIVDRETYQVLALKKVDRRQVWIQSVYTHREWTNKEPTAPTPPAGTPTK